MPDRAQHIRLSFDAIDGEERIVGVYLNRPLVETVLPPGQPEPPKTWLVRGTWPTSAHEMVRVLAIKKLATLPGANLFLYPTATHRLSKRLKPPPSFAIGEGCPKRSLARSPIEPREGFVLLKELQKYLAVGWQRACGDKEEVQNRSNAFWRSLSLSIETRRFDAADDRLIDEFNIPLTADRWKGVQTAAEGVFNTAEAVGRYLETAHAPRGALAKWAEETGYGCPASWLLLELSHKQEPVFYSDLVKAAVDRVGPWQRIKNKPGYMKIEAYRNVIERNISQVDGVSVSLGRIKQVLDDIHRGPKKSKSQSPVDLD